MNQFNKKLSSEDDVNNEKTTPKRGQGKYTRGSIGHCPYGGWTAKGLQRFNQLCLMVKADRNHEHAYTRETQFRERFKQWREQNIPSKHKQKKHDEDDDNLYHMDVFCEL